MYFCEYDSSRQNCHLDKYSDLYRSEQLPTNHHHLTDQIPAYTQLEYKAKKEGIKVTLSFIFRSKKIIFSAK